MGVLAFALVLVGSATASAAENCPCGIDQEIHSKINSLVRTQLSIQQKLAPLQGRAFHKSPEEIEALKLFADHERTLQETCPELYTKVKRGWHVAMRAVIGPAGEVLVRENPDSPAEALRGGEEAFKLLRPEDKVKMSDLDPACRDNYAIPESKLKGRAVAVRESCQEQNRKIYAERRAAYEESLSVEARGKSFDKLLDDLGSESGGPTRLQVAVIKAFAAKDEQEFHQFLKGMRNKLSEMEKVQLVTQVMGAGEDRFYDKDLSDLSAKNPRAWFVDPKNEAVFKTLKGYVFGRRDREKTRIICRHLAALGAGMAEDLGMEGFVVSSNREGILHSSVLLRDPNGGSSAYLGDYARLAKVWGKEGGALLDESQQGLGNGAAVYMVSRANSATSKEPAVALIAGESLKIYAEALGSDIRKLEPMARTTTSVAMAQTTIAGLPTTLFVGTDGNGNRYAGAASHLDWQIGSPRNPGSIGVATAYRPPQEGHQEGTMIDVHFQADQKLSDKVFDFKAAGTRFQGEIDALALVMVDGHAHLGGGRDPRVGVGVPVAGLNAGAQVEATSAGGAVAARVRGETHARMGTSDVSAMTPNVFHDKTVASAQVTVNAGKHQAMAETMIMLDAFGPKVLGTLGYGISDFAVTLGAGGRVNADDATIREGSIRRGEVQAAQKLPVGPSKDLTIFLGGSSTFEPGDPAPDRRITGGFSGSF